MNVYEVSFDIEKPGVTYHVMTLCEAPSPQVARFIVYSVLDKGGFKSQQVKINHIRLIEKGVTTS